MNLIIESRNISKGRQLQIEKDKYLDDIHKYKQVEVINVECKEIKEEQCENISRIRDSMNFVEVKDNFVF